MFSPHYDWRKAGYAFPKHAMKGTIFMVFLLYLVQIQNAIGIEVSEDLVQATIMIIQTYTFWPILVGALSEVSGRAMKLVVSG